MTSFYEPPRERTWWRHIILLLQRLIAKVAFCPVDMHPVTEFLWQWMGCVFVYIFMRYCVFGMAPCFVIVARPAISPPTFFFQLSLLLRIVLVMNQKECQVDFIFKYWYRYSAVESCLNMRWKTTVPALQLRCLWDKLINCLEIRPQKVAILQCTGLVWQFRCIPLIEEDMLVLVQVALDEIYLLCDIWYDGM